MRRLKREVAQRLEASEESAEAASGSASSSAAAVARFLRIRIIVEPSTDQVERVEEIHNGGDRGSSGCQWVKLRRGRGERGGFFVVDADLTLQEERGKGAEEDKGASDRRQQEPPVQVAPSFWNHTLRAVPLDCLDMKSNLRILGLRTGAKLPMKELECVFGHATETGASYHWRCWVLSRLLQRTIRINIADRQIHRYYSCEVTAPADAPLQAPLRIKQDGHVLYQNVDPRRDLACFQFPGNLATVLTATTTRLLDPVNMASASHPICPRVQFRMPFFRFTRKAMPGLSRYVAAAWRRANIQDAPPAPPQGVERRTHEHDVLDAAAATNEDTPAAFSWIVLLPKKAKKWAQRGYSARSFQTDGEQVHWAMASGTHMTQAAARNRLIKEMDVIEKKLADAGDPRKDYSLPLLRPGGDPARGYPATGPGHREVEARNRLNGSTP